MPLLFETGAWRFTSPRILVDCPAEERVRGAVGWGVRSSRPPGPAASHDRPPAHPLSSQAKRVMARDGLTRADADARVAAQEPAAPKRARCHIVIDNNGDVSAAAAAARAAAEGLKAGLTWHMMLTPPALLAALGAAAAAVAAA